MIFQIPYITSKAVVVVHSDNDSIKSFADLKGKKSSQSLTSNFAQLAKSSGPRWWPLRASTSP